MLSIIKSLLTIINKQLISDFFNTTYEKPILPLKIKNLM